MRKAPSRDIVSGRHRAERTLSQIHLKMEGISDTSSAVPAKAHDTPKSSSGEKHHHKENGVSNGPSSNHHSSSHKSSKHHSSSSSKHHSSSSSSKHHSSSSGDKKHHSSSSSKHHSSSSGDKKHHSSSSGDKKHSSSSSKHSSSSSGDKKHHSSSSSGDKKHHSSSSSGDKKHSSSSGDKKHHSSSSSSKHKDGHHSSSSSSKHKEHRDKHKDKHGSSSEHKVKTESQEQKLVVKSEPVSPVKQPKTEPMGDSEDDMPLITRTPKVESPQKVVKRELSDDEDDDVPLAARSSQKEKKIKKEDKKEAKKRKNEDDEDYDDAPIVKKKIKPAAKKSPAVTSPTKKGKKKEEPEEKWRWWEEERKDDGTKWHFLEHKGPVFAPEYEPLPANVKFYYDGKHMHLEPEAEEVMTFYARMIDHDYTSMEVFNKNFFKDWRSVMTSQERERIKDLTKCNFKEVDAHFKRKSEERKAMSKEEKNAIKEENARIVEEYGFCTMDNHKEKIGNFRIEPPGLFRGRGSHPKMGTLKRRVMPEDIIINCSKDSVIPKPPEGHKWKEVRFDNTVTWLVSWTENVQGGTKYIMLNPASRLKGEKDWMKYETARKLHKIVDKIRATYREDWKSKEMRIRQRAVALYFIDKLALRAGNEKDEDTADTVGCCSLRVEHLTCHEEMDGKEFVVEFDFLGKDSIRYYNKVAVEKRVFKNLQLFMDNKAPGDDLFDRLNTTIMNKHLQSLMDGLTAKVFRTYNASRTLQEQLDLLTEADDPVASKLLSYNRANRAVAVLCNHQRAVPKNFSKQMENMQAKIDAKKDAIHTAKKDLKAAKSDFKNCKTDKTKTLVERKKKAVERLQEQLEKLEVAQTDKDENKDIALGTSKLNYLDPRISVAWCKKWDVPIEKIYNKTQRDKFAWAIDMADETYVF